MTINRTTLNSEVEQNNKSLRKTKDTRRYCFILYVGIYETQSSIIDFGEKLPENTHLLTCRTILENRETGLELQS